MNPLLSRRDPDFPQRIYDLYKDGKLSSGAMRKYLNADFFCSECGLVWIGPQQLHSADECTLAGVMLS